jgi:hypothetical protein
MPKKPQHAVLSTDCFGVKIYLAGKCMRYFWLYNSRYIFLKSKKLFAVFLIKSFIYYRNFKKYLLLLSIYYLNSTYNSENQVFFLHLFLNQGDLMGI